MANYKPTGPFNVPMLLYVPTSAEAKGSAKKIYPSEGVMIFCSFRTFGGTENTTNGVLTVEDTAVIETWFRPDIKSDCILKDVDGVKYEILGKPENINQRNQVLRFKIRSVRGGA